MNTRTDSRKWSWIQLDERRAARTAILLLLLLLLALPGVVQAQFNYTINNGAITITGYYGPGGDVIIPEALGGLPVTSIGMFAFQSCTNLTSVTIPTSILNIGNWAFAGCGGLTNITIPNSVTSVGAGAFNDCGSLTAITVAANNPFYSSVNGVLFRFDQSQTILVQCPGGKEGAYTIPNSVTDIGPMGFFCCKRLTSVTVPNGVTYLGQDTFSHCFSLIGVYFKGNAPSLGGLPVFSQTTNVTVYYLPGTTGWGATFGGRPTVLWDLPAILTSPRTQTAEAGSAVGLWVDATGSLPLLYLWCSNDTNLISCSTNCELELTNVQFSQSGAYCVVVSNALGAVTSAPAALNVTAAVERRPVPGIQVTGQTGSVLNLDYADFLRPSPNWTTVGSVSLVSTSQYWFDLTLPLPPQRFFQAWQAGAPGVIPSLDLHQVPAITLTGSIGGSVRVDAINQFGPTDAWFTLYTVTLTNTSQLYFDTSAPGQPQRLYQLVPLP